MAHVREQVRNAIVAILEAAPTEWASVLNTRMTPFRDLTPFVLVFADGETVDNTTVHGPSIQERSISITTMGMVRVSDDTQATEDKLDAVAAELETTLIDSALRTGLSNNSVWIDLQSTEIDLDIDEENERVYAGISLVWLVRLYTEEGQPETIVS